MTDQLTTIKLPVSKIFVESFQLVKERLNTFIRIGMPLFVLMLFSSFVAKYDFAGQSILLSAVFSAFVLVTGVIVLVGCHQTFLLSDNEINKIEVIRWGANETKFIGWWLAIGVIIMLLSIPFMFFLLPFLKEDANSSNYLIPLISVFAYYFISRWSLVLPATAVEDADASLSYAWNLSDGNGWRLALLIGGVPFLTDNFLNLLPSFDSVFYLLISNFIWLMVGLFEVGLLSLSYSYLKGGVSNINQEVKA